MLSIRIELIGHPSMVNLNLRNTLSDTLEDRKVGEVIYEQIGDTFIEVGLEVLRSPETDDEIISVLKSLGLFQNSKLRYEEL
jgi:hypothetical protein